MSLNAIMNTALTGLFTNQSALRVTSNNIANVNTPGYAREVVRQEAMSNGSYAGGVKISDVQRVVDRFLDDSMLSTGSQASRYGVEQQFHDRIQALLGRPDSQSSLAGRLDTLFQKIGATAQDPAKAVLRQDALAGVQDFGNEMSRIADELQRLRADAGNQISESVAQINALLSRIDALNPLIVKERVLGHPIGPLEEQRAQALKELANLVDIRVQDQPNGAVQVTTTNGAVLLGGARYELRYSAPGTATSETIFPPVTLHLVDPTSGAVDPAGTPLDGAVSGGALKGLLELRDVTLPDMAAELGQFSGMVIDRLNAIHNAATAFPPPPSLSGSNTGLVGTDLHGFTGVSAFKIVDGNGNVMASTTVDFDSLPAGATIADVVAAINAGLGGAGTASFAQGRLTFSAAGAGNGVVIVDDPARPTDRGGRGFSHFFGMNDLVEAKVPVNHNTGFSGTDAHGFAPGSTVHFEIIGSNNKIFKSYTLTVGGGDFNSLLADLNGPGGLGAYVTATLDAKGGLVLTPKPGFDGIDINVKSDSTSRGDTGVTLSSLFGIGDRYLADRASGVVIKSAILNKPQQLALGQATFAAGVGQSAITSGNNDGAKAFQALELQALAFAPVGKLSGVNGTLAQYGAAILSNMGLLAAQATNRHADTLALAQDVEERRNSLSGVNMDEELSNMVMYQNAYNASTRIISVVRDMYDALLSLV